MKKEAVNLKESRQGLESGKKREKYNYNLNNKIVKSKNYLASTYMVMEWVVTRIYFLSSTPI